jgi:hypothetical protein
VVPDRAQVLDRVPRRPTGMRSFVTRRPLGLSSPILSMVFIILLGLDLGLGLGLGLGLVVGVVEARLPLLRMVLGVGGRR